MTKNLQITIKEDKKAVDYKKVEYDKRSRPL